MGLSESSSLVLPMVKDFFLVGVLVAECIVPKVEEIFRSTKLRAVRPEWPPHKGSIKAGDGENKTALPSSEFTCFTPEQEAEGRKIARSLAIGCVMDQVGHLIIFGTFQKLSAMLVFGRKMTHENSES